MKQEPDRRLAAILDRTIETIDLTLTAIKPLAAAALFALPISCFVISASAVAQSTAPFNRYLAAAESGKQDPRITAFVRECDDTEIKPVKKVFYTEQNDWLAAKDLHFAFAGYDTGDANTAEVWQFAGSVRVIYLWEVDLEYQRDTLFCLNRAGEVTKAVSRFFPSQSGEPREHWTYINTVKPVGRENMWQSIGVYEDARGKHMDKPELSTEDRDFIAGERPYHYLNDFDFAHLLGVEKPKPPAAASAQKETHATP